MLLRGVAGDGRSEDLEAGRVLDLVTGFPVLEVLVLDLFLGGPLAVGFLAVGFVATGRLALGRLATGFLSVGLVAAGCVTAGRLALGRLATGFLSVGLVATGCLAVACLRMGLRPAGRGGAGVVLEDGEVIVCSLGDVVVRLRAGLLSGFLEDLGSCRDGFRSTDLAPGVTGDGVIVRFDDDCLVAVVREG
jgi:hypothetical protein